jgi:hypothetical protein
MIQLLGVGHPLIDRALAKCSGRQVYIARMKGLANPFVTAFVEDEVTGAGATVHRVVLASRCLPMAPCRCRRDETGRHCFG